eukprot:2894936-Amphidinium_carterae.1
MLHAYRNKNATLIAVESVGGWVCACRRASSVCALTAAAQTEMYKSLKEVVVGLHRRQKQLMRISCPRIKTQQPFCDLWFDLSTLAWNRTACSFGARATVLDSNCAICEPMLKACRDSSIVRAPHKLRRAS